MLEARGLFRSAICFRSILSRQNGLNRHMEQKKENDRKSSFSVFRPTGVGKWPTGVSGSSCIGDFNGVCALLGGFARFSGLRGLHGKSMEKRSMENRFLETHISQNNQGLKTNWSFFETFKFVAESSKVMALTFRCGFEENSPGNYFLNR